MNTPPKMLICLAILVSGCGGSDEHESRLLVIGNSITRHDPIPGWSGDHGMAASERAKDFAHMTGAALKMPVTTVNMAKLEYDSNADVPDFDVRPDTVVVVELGDNGMPAKYAELLAKVRGGAALVCVSTWWADPNKDAIIKAECGQVGGVYAFIGDLLPRSEDPVGVYEDAGIDAHPKDWGMRMISERILSALLTLK